MKRFLFLYSPWLMACIALLWFYQPILEFAISDIKRTHYLVMERVSIVYAVAVLLAMAIPVAWMVVKWRRRRNVG